MREGERGIKRQIKRNKETRKGDRERRVLAKDKDKNMIKKERERRDRKTLET